MTTTFESSGVGGTSARPGAGPIGIAILRITLGVVILATWRDNLTSDFYTVAGIEGFFDYLYKPVEDGGNASSLSWYQSLIDHTLLRVTGAFVVFQTIGEFLIGLGLLIGGFTRLFSLAAVVFFANLFLAYFGGEEWIWTYVLLMVASLTVFLNHGGRTFGIDHYLAKARDRSPMGLLW